MKLTIQKKPDEDKMSDKDKKKAERKRMVNWKTLSDWIDRNQGNYKGTISIKDSIILEPKYEIQTPNIGTELSDYLKTYIEEVYLIDYEDIDEEFRKDSLNKLLSIDLFKEAIKRVKDKLLDAMHPNWKNIHPDGSSIEFFSILLWRENKATYEETFKIIVYPAVGFKLYNRYYKRDKNGKSIIYDDFNYLHFFVDNIQEYKDIYPDGEDAPPVRMYEGLSLNSFMKKYVDNNKKHGELVLWMYHQLELNSIREEKCNLVHLLQELEREGKQVCIYNFIVLAEFIKDKIESRYFAFMEPTTDDILVAIEKLEGVSKVVFEDDKGYKVICEKEEHIELLKEAFRDKITTDKRVFKIKLIFKWSEIADNTIIQALFVQDMTQFLKKYFPGRRKKDSNVSTAEKELILWAMNYVGLSDGDPTNTSRYRTLDLYLKNSNIDRHPDFKILPERFEKLIGTRIIAIDFLPWEQWQSNINFSQPIKKWILGMKMLYQIFSKK